VRKWVPGYGIKCQEIVNSSGERRSHVLSSRRTKGVPAKNWNPTTKSWGWNLTTENWELKTGDLKRAMTAD